MTLERMWINQPALGQTHHKLHGVNVLACVESGTQRTTVKIYFLSGNVISQTIDKSALSRGWRLKENQ